MRYRWCESNSGFFSHRSVMVTVVLDLEGATVPGLIWRFSLGRFTRGSTGFSGGSYGGALAGVCMCMWGGGVMEYIG